jgi:hypothetical protein
MAHNTNPMSVVSTSITIRLEIAELHCESITCCNILLVQILGRSKLSQHALTKHFRTGSLVLALQTQITTTEFQVDAKPFFWRRNAFLQADYSQP